MAINLRNAMLYDLSFVLVVVFFSSHFLKANLFEGVPVWEVWEVFAQKLYLGVKNMCKKFREHPTVGLDFMSRHTFDDPSK